MSADLLPIAERAEVLLAELAGLSQRGPLLRIAHRFQRLGADCQAGEEIWAISIVNRGREALLSLITWPKRGIYRKAQLTLRLG